MFDGREAALNLEEQHAAAVAVLLEEQAQGPVAEAEAASSLIQCGASNVWNHGDSPQVRGRGERGTVSDSPGIDHPQLLLLHMSVPLSHVLDDNLVASPTVSASTAPPLLLPLATCSPCWCPAVLPVSLGPQPEAPSTEAARQRPRRL